MPLAPVLIYADRFEVNLGLWLLPHTLPCLHRHVQAAKGLNGMRTYIYICGPVQTSGSYDPANFKLKNNRNNEGI